MKPFLRPMTVLVAGVTLALFWLLSGCAPVHNCGECPPQTHVHSQDIGKPAPALPARGVCPDCGRW